MKKIIIFLLLITYKIFCKEEILIDFNNLKDTTIDFTKFITKTNITEEDIKAYKIDLNIKNWNIRVNESSWTNEARKKTYLLSVTKSTNYPDIQVLGIKIFFPERYANSYAVIKPPYSIPSYYDNPEKSDGSGGMFLNKGIVRNIGILRKITVRYLGNNFAYSLYVRIEDHNGVQKDVFIGPMNFVGWRSIAWVNGNLDNELKYRDLNKNYLPYYPDEYPFVKFIGFVIQRSDPAVTGNFVTMIKDISVEYDEAFLELGYAENNQEQIFQIYHDELIDRAKIATERINQRLYFEWLESKKIHKETDVVPDKGK